MPFLRTGLLFVTQDSFDLFEKVKGRAEKPVPRLEKSLQLHTWVWRGKKTQRLRSEFNRLRAFS